MTAPRATITVPEVMPRVHALYDRHEAGCCLHIVLDDGNLDDDSVRFCMNFAAEHGHKECHALATTMLAMSTRQRGKLYHRKRIR